MDWMQSVIVGLIFLFISGILWYWFRKGLLNDAGSDDANHRKGKYSDKD